MSKLPFLIGTYTDSGSLGIHKATFDPFDGAFSKPALFYEINEPKFLIYNHGQIITTSRQDKKAGIIFIDTNQPLISLKDSAWHDQSTSCFITRKDQLVVTANYHDGSMLIYEIIRDKLELKHKFNLGKLAKCHQVFFYDHYLFLICLGLDEIHIYDENLDFEHIKTIEFPKGTGPRQAILDSTASFLYVLSELSNEIYTFRRVKGMDFQGVQINTVLPKGTKTTNASAAICMNQDGQHIYTTTRGCNIITVFEVERGFLKPVQYIECGGDHPREMKLDPTSNFLLVANRYSNNILSFRLDLSGLICEQCDEIEVPQPCCIEFM